MSCKHIMMHGNRKGFECKNDNYDEYDFCEKHYQRYYCGYNGCLAPISKPNSICKTCLPLKTVKDLKLATSVRRLITSIDEQDRINALLFNKYL